MIEGLKLNVLENVDDNTQIRIQSNGGKLNLLKNKYIIIYYIFIYKNIKLSGMPVNNKHSYTE